MTTYNTLQIWSRNKSLIRTPESVSGLAVQERDMLQTYRATYQYELGSFVLNGATPVTVYTYNQPYVTLITLSVPGGTVGALPSIQTVYNTSVPFSFTVSGTAGDTSTYYYLILPVAPLPAITVPTAY